MDGLWIIHRDERSGEALARLAGAGPGTRVGRPGDPAFDRDDVPAVIVIGVSQDADEELDFVRIQAARRRDARFVLVHDPGLPVARVEAWFAGLDAERLVWPPSAGALRQAVARAGAPATLALPARRLRSRLERRGSRFFQDLDLPAAFEAPGRGAESALVRGEGGTGRLLLCRLLHARGPDATRPFLAIACEEDTTAQRLAGQVAAAPEHAVVCLENADRLPQTVQRSVAGWIELGDGPGGVARAFCATAGPEWAAPPLEGSLDLALSRLRAELPPLRERTALIEPFAVVLIAEWAGREARPAPAITPEAMAQLASQPWPGNLRELEAVLLRTLAADPGDPIEAHALALGDAPRPVSAPARHDALPDTEDALDALGGPPVFGDPHRDGTHDAFADEPGSDSARATGDPTDAPREVLDETDGELDDVAGWDFEDDPEESVERMARERVAAAPEAAALPALELVEGGGARPAGPKRVPRAEPAADATGSPLLQRLARALAHEARNPLTAVRTFAQLLPERFDDPEFRGEFRQQVDADLGRLERLVTRVAELADLRAGEPQRVDVTRLLEELLEERRPEIQSRRLLVLQELDATRPLALGDPALLRLALSALVDRALAWVPERADLFVATQYDPVGPEGDARVRILLRFYSPDRPTPRPGGAASADVALGETSLDVILAEQAVRAQGGTLRVDDTQADETVLAIDLHAE